MDRPHVARIVGSKIRALRTSRKMSLSDLSSGARLDRSRLSKIERGEAETSLETYAAIAQQLGVPLDRLFRVRRAA